MKSRIRKIISVLLIFGLMVSTTQNFKVMANDNGKLDVIHEKQSELTVGVNSSDEKIATTTLDHTSVKSVMRDMTPFYRYHVALGEKVGAPLRLTPDFLTDESLSFPYKRRPFDTEAMFGSNLNLVRFLGAGKVAEDNGAALNDLAFRDESGKICYKFGDKVPDDQNYIKIKLDPYINNGYNKIRIVLDNIPFCFTKTPKIGRYGNYAMPDNLEEWEDFISAVCDEMIRLYGYETVSNFAYRMGTEADGLQRITASVDDYITLYTSTYKVIHEKFPNAEFGPYNNFKFKTLGPGQIASIGHLNKVLSNAKNNNLKCDWVSFSDYFNSPGNMDYQTDKVVSTYNDATRNLGTKPSFEIHEWSVSNGINGALGFDFGAKGAAATFHNLMNLYRDGVDRVYHWNLTEGIEENGKRCWFNSGIYWLFSILDYTEGAQTYELEMSTDIDSTDLAQKAVAFMNSDDHMSMIIISSYNSSKTEQQDGNITVYIPKSILPEGIDAKTPIKYVNYTTENAVYDIIIDDYSEKGILKSKYEESPFSCDRISQLVDSKNVKTARQLLMDNYDNKYLPVMQDSLKLKDYSETLLDCGSYYTISVNMDAPETIALVLDYKQPIIEERKPSIEIDFSNNQLIGFKEESPYEINGEMFQTKQSEVPINNEFYGSTISIVKKASNEIHSDSVVQNIQIPNKPKAPEVIAKVLAVPGGGIGTISPTETGMEYRNIKTDEWITCSEDSTTINEYGTYEVRLKATSESFASATLELSFSETEKDVMSEVTPDSTPVITKDFKISYNLPIGKLQRCPEEYKVGTKYVLPIPERRGYEFIGWYESAECSGEPVTSLIVTKQAEIKLYPSWKPLTYKVVYHFNDGTKSQVDERTYGDYIKLIKPVREGYTFAGWYRNDSLIGIRPTIISAKTIGDTEFFAKWIKNK